MEPPPWFDAAMKTAFEPIMHKLNDIEHRLHGMIMHKLDEIEHRLDGIEHKLSCIELNVDVMKMMVSSASAQPERKLATLSCVELNVDVIKMRGGPANDDPRPAFAWDNPRPAFAWSNLRPAPGYGRVCDMSIDGTRCRNLAEDNGVCAACRQRWNNATSAAAAPPPCRCSRVQPRGSQGELKSWPPPCGPQCWLRGAGSLC